MKNPYPENKQPNRIEDTESGGERLVTKWYDHDGVTSVVVVPKERAYWCYGFDDIQGRLFRQ